MISPVVQIQSFLYSTSFEKWEEMQQYTNIFHNSTAKHYLLTNHFFLLQKEAKMQKIVPSMKINLP